MEKRVVTYNLEAIKQAFSNVNTLRITTTGLMSARSLGFQMQEIIDTIQQLKRSDFIKSMTTYANHRIWQDVYNTEYNGYSLYLKFQKDELGHFIISFKEK